MMVWQRFSEFSYGFALTSEIITRSKADLVKAPEFPNLKKEGKVGYDLKLEWPLLTLLLQFKSVNAMTTNRAKESHVIKPEFYRMHLRAANVSKQHALLMNHQKKGGSAVYYAAPGFYEALDFDRFYQAGKLIEASAFFRPLDIGKLPDDGNHHVSFRRDSPVAYRCSEPVEIPKPLTGETAREALLGRDRIAGRPRAETDLPELYRDIWSMASAVRGEERETPTGVELTDLPSRRLPPLDLRVERMPHEIADLARRFLDCQVIFLQVEPKG